MRTELEIEQFGATTPSRSVRPPKASRPVWLWAAIACVVGAIVLALFLYKSDPTPKVVVAGASPRSIAISADGARLAVGLLDGSLRIVAVNSGKTIARFKTEQPLAAVAALTFGPDDSVLLLRAGEPKLHIFSSDLQTHSERSAHPNAHDLVWSRALDAALVLTGGDDDLHAKIEVFPAHPLGIENSTAQLIDLITWAAPKHIAISADGSRLAVSYPSTRRLNVLVYDPRARRTASALLLRGVPEGLAFSADGMRMWAASPQVEAVTEVAPFATSRIEYPKLASTSPPRMLAVNERTRRAYTTGSLTFPEVDLDRRRISRTVELPERASGIALSLDGSTAYLTFEKLDIIGIVDLKAMRWVREIQLR